MSARYNVLLAMQSTLQTIIPANGYTNDLSALGAVTVGIASREQRLAGSHAVQVQIEEGEEQHEISFASPVEPRKSTWEILLDCMLRGWRDEEARSRLNTFLEDVSLAIGSDVTLGGSVIRAHHVRTYAPQYDTEPRVSWVVVSVAVDREYTAGTTA